MDLEAVAFAIAGDGADSDALVLCRPEASPLSRWLLPSSLGKSDWTKTFGRRPRLRFFCVFLGIGSLIGCGLFK